MENCRLRLFVFLAVICSVIAASTAAETISLKVDATKTPQKILRVHLAMAVKAGPLTLYYPKWIPGEHGPDGPIANIANLKFDADGTEIPWTRDLTDVWTLHV